ncbi:MAG TPA: PD-(D/E)XK nuclease family protein [Anaerolineae bacterium]|nr:PD-(D/E)XK nuclease family protein [Anaerolineae bacterium]
MTLPLNFRFSQASLADYLDCRRRFQLRYLLEQAWPAVESEPLLERERLAELGRRFHRLIQQHVEGLSVETLTASIGEPELARWWQSYLASLDNTLSDLPAQRRAEAAISIPFKTYRLTAHFDLIASDDQRVVIVDWKTEHRLPTREQLRQRLQTRVYRYVLTIAQQRPPGTVSMIYWFAQAERPDQLITLPYDAAQQADDHKFLSELIAEIEQRAAQEGEWEKTPDERKCAYCVYRSLCNRGVYAGTSDPDEEDFDLAVRINIEQIDAIEY